MRSARVLWLTAALIAAVPSVVPAQAPARAPAETLPPMKPAAEDAPLAAPVPVDPRITVGTLPNGLRYYIRRNAKPAGRAELRLVVNAGSVLEDDDQRGLAHFVEHMAFNGTTHFPKQDIIEFLQSIGMRFGAARQRLHRASTRPSTCCRFRPTSPTSSTGVPRPRGLGRTA